jgi:hypothetical protein
MEQEIEESIKKKCNDSVYYIQKEQEARKGKNDTFDDLLDFLEEHYADQLPTDGGFTDIIIGKYEVLVSNHRNKYNTVLDVDVIDEPPTPVTLESATAEDAPHWALSALTTLFPKKEEE